LGKTDNNNRIFKKFYHNKRIFLLLIWTYRTGLLECDNINQMITLSVITLSGFHCTLHYLRNREYFIIFSPHILILGSLCSCFACTQVHQSPLGLWHIAAIRNCICIQQWPLAGKFSKFEYSPKICCFWRVLEFAKTSNPPNFCQSRQRIWQVLSEFYKFCKFGEFGKFGKGRLDSFIPKNIFFCS
jgi:hypothetical protein